MQALAGGAVQIGSATVVAAPLTAPAHGISVVLLEEDTYRSLAADSALKVPAEHPVRALTEAQGVEPAEGGSVIDAGGRPRRLLVVIHDLDREPSWQPEWVAEGLRRALKLVDQLGIENLGMPILGTVHGRLAWPEAVELALSALAEQDGRCPTRVWLMVPEERLEATVEAMRAFCSR